MSRLKELEAAAEFLTLPIVEGEFGIEDIKWLINRVRVLTEALENIGTYPIQDNPASIAIGLVECRGIARKALEDE